MNDTTNNATTPTPNNIYYQNIICNSVVVGKGRVVGEVVPRE